ncbi:MAG: Holliday junction branch migration protein RuvA [Candidatus Aadella gelida]|nr:Holliday junction branch migration protein RuvA [Candidatus Aadella gelida]
MIARISGVVAGKKENTLILDTGGMCYEVLIPLAVMNSIKEEKTFEEKVELITYHYFQMSQTSAVPILIGFQNDIEKEFFEKFISVSGIGPKAACRALAEPFSVIAGAIDRGDEVYLKKLPGIGSRKAAEIVAKLRGRVGKYGLIQDDERRETKNEKEDIKSDALEILLQLQYKKNEAENMIEKALQREPELKTSEELLNEVYRERSGK